MSGEEVTDEALLARAARDRDPDAFAAFYRRHARPLAGYFVRRTRDAELAADLTAETFAAALVGVGRFDAERGPAVGWLYGIARHQLAHAHRRGRVEDRARRRLGMEPIGLDDAGLEAVERAGTENVAEVLADLPVEQRDAVRARVLEERDYADIALSAETSESVIRKRVSRGLAGLRTRLEEEPRP